MWELWAMNMQIKLAKEGAMVERKPTGQLEIHKQITERQAVSEHQKQNRSLQHAKKNCSSPIQDGNRSRLPC